jgi:hypothetical protein
MVIYYWWAVHGAGAVCRERGIGVYEGYYWWYHCDNEKREKLAIATTLG